MTDVGRMNHDDGSVSFVATFDAADALRADPQVLDKLEEAMRGAVTDITGEDHGSPRAQGTRRVWFIVWGACKVLTAIAVALVTIFAVFLLVVFLLGAAASAIAAVAEAAWGLFR